jgi:hypothetical protein
MQEQLLLRTTPSYVSGEALAADWFCDWRDRAPPLLFLVEQRKVIMHTSRSITSTVRRGGLSKGTIGTDRRWA